MWSVDDVVRLDFRAPVGSAVTATVTDPAGVTVAVQPLVPDSFDPENYPFGFAPISGGLWRVTFRAPGVASVTHTVRVGDTVGGWAPYASAQDVAAIWRPLDPAETERADVLARYASAAIRSRLPDTDRRIAEGLLAAEVATLVVVGMVLRVLHNPGGVVSETVGPWSVQYGARGATGTLTLTDEDVALLTGSVGERRGNARAVRGDNIFLPPRCGVRAWGAET